MLLNIFHETREIPLSLTFSPVSGLSYAKIGKFWNAFLFSFSIMNFEDITTWNREYFKAEYVMVYFIRTSVVLTRFKDFPTYLKVILLLSFKSTKFCSKKIYTPLNKIDPLKVRLYGLFWNSNKWIWNWKEFFKALIYSCVCEKKISSDILCYLNF